MNHRIKGSKERRCGNEGKKREGKGEKEGLDEKGSSVEILTDRNRSHV